MTVFLDFKIYSINIWDFNTVFAIFAELSWDSNAAYRFLNVIAIVKQIHSYTRTII